MNPYTNIQDSIGNQRLRLCEQYDTEAAIEVRELGEVPGAEAGKEEFNG